MTSHYVWTIRYPHFLERVKKEFLNSKNLAKKRWQGNDVSSEDPLSWEYQAMNRWEKVYRIEKGETKRMNLSFSYAEGEELHPIVHCGLPDGTYRVLDAYYEDGSPYYLNIVDGSYDNKELALAGAYSNWCRESKKPTGSPYKRQNYGPCVWYYGSLDECYDVHNYIEKTHFDIDKKTVFVDTCSCWGGYVDSDSDSEL